MSSRRFCTTLRSGMEATVFRLDADTVEILPLFCEPPLAPVEKLVRRIGEARFGQEFGTVSISGLASLRLEASNLKTREMLVNGGYFIFQMEEIGPYDRYGDPIGLVAEGGEILSPPLFGRATLIRTKSGWQISHLSSDDCRLTGTEWSDGTEVYFADRHPLSPAPMQPAIDLIVKERTIVARIPASATRVPICGCIVRVPEGRAPAVGTTVQYEMNTALDAGIQAGPVLVEHRALAPQTDRSFATERLGGTTPPYGWHANWHETRAARLAAGIDERGALFICAVEGGSSAVQGGVSVGATLADMAALMFDQGAHDAINLDGGGSVQVFDAGGGAFVKSGEFFRGAALSGGEYERAVPTALKLRLK